MTVKRKKKRLPYNYLERYLGLELAKADHEFITGCLIYQRKYPQLTISQWEIIKKIEKKYLSKT